MQEPIEWDGADNGKHVWFYVWRPIIVKVVIFKGLLCASQFVTWQGKNLFLLEKRMTEAIALILLLALGNMFLCCRKGGTNENGPLKAFHSHSKLMPNKRSNTSL